jgi:hypothetical protein
MNGYEILKESVEVSKIPGAAAKENLVQSEKLKKKRRGELKSGRGGSNGASG